MQYSEILGISSPEIGWVPSPTYILRRAAILDLIVHLAPGRLLEIGCGAGTLLIDLANKGFYGIGIEISKDALNMASEILEDLSQFQVLNKTKTLEDESFDYLFSFEVLEHTQNDIDTLNEWLRFLKPGGTVLLSVPAHRKKWNITDIMAGHYRRYDKADIINLLESTELSPIRICTYGWPFTPLIEKARIFTQYVQLFKNNTNVRHLKAGDLEMTKKSGINRQNLVKLFPIYGSKFGEYVFKNADRLQKSFFNTQLGISFLILARKSG